MISNIVELPSRIGYLQTKFNLSDLKPLIDEIKRISRSTADVENMTWDLAGQIEKEFKLTDSVPFLQNLIIPYLKEFDSKFRYMEEIAMLSEDCDLYLKRAWVNFQKKYEYNPVHKHNGVFSFVIWLNIPFTTDEELAVSPGKTSNNPYSSGEFCFYHTTGLGKIVPHRIVCDKSTEGTMLVFPASLPHSVNPFFSNDQYRITVSGNFFFKVGNKND